MGVARCVQCLSALGTWDTDHLTPRSFTLYVKIFKKKTDIHGDLDHCTRSFGKMKAIKNCPWIWKWVKAMFRMCKVDHEAALERLALAVYPDVYSPRERAHDFDTYTVFHGPAASTPLG